MFDIMHKKHDYIYFFGISILATDIDINIVREYTKNNSLEIYIRKSYDTHNGIITYHLIFNVDGDVKKRTKYELIRMIDIDTVEKFKTMCIELNLRYDVKIICCDTSLNYDCNFAFLVTKS